MKCFSRNKMVLQIKTSCHSMGLRAIYLRFVKSLGNERVPQIVDKERCIKEQTFFELLVLAAFISPVNFSKIVFAV